jgi:hypothetical protein
MSQNIENTNGPWTIKLFGLMLPALPSLLIRFGGTFLRFKRNAKKGGKVFQRELINQGLDKKIAEELTEKYLEGSNLSKYLFQYIR